MEASVAVLGWELNAESEKVGGYIGLWRWATSVGETPLNGKTMVKPRTKLTRETSFLVLKVGLADGGSWSYNICLSGAQMASIHEIKKCQKSRDTAPLSRILFSGKIHKRLRQSKNQWSLCKFTLKIWINLQLLPIFIHFCVFLQLFPPGFASGSKSENEWGSGSTFLIKAKVLAFRWEINMKVPASTVNLD